MKKRESILNMHLGVARSEAFDDLYKKINQSMVIISNDQSSRNGDILEKLNFKTELLNPRMRCVGGQDRNVNVFFLLAEAMWIWSGRKDLEFLKKFNKGMENFSDDGKTFHAPYGFRLRNYGISSSDNYLSDSQKHSLQGTDQIEEAIKMLTGLGVYGEGDEETRRIAMSIWNVDLDLNAKTKDVPCNDLVFFQKRDDKLHITISNRSNDLHWGLPTNIFQFSWILETVGLITNIELGTQVHNSKSLHIYKGNKISNTMISSLNTTNLYDVSTLNKMDFKFKSKNPIKRLAEFDSFINSLLRYLSRESKIDLNKIKEKSEYFYNIVLILDVYIDYKRSTTSDESRVIALCRLLDIRPENNPDDFKILSLNFFYKRLQNKELLNNAIVESFVKYGIGNL